MEKQPSFEGEKQEARLYDVERLTQGDFWDMYNALEEMINATGGEDYSLWQEIKDKLNNIISAMDLDPGANEKGVVVRTKSGWADAWGLENNPEYRSKIEERDRILEEENTSTRHSTSKIRGEEPTA